MVDSRVMAEEAQVRRRRECGDCGGRFTTFEVAELKMPRIVKRDGKRMYELARKGQAREIQTSPWTTPVPRLYLAPISPWTSP